MTPRRALASALLAAALALSACGGGGGGGDDGDEPPTPAEAWNEITARIAEEGSSPELALQAFTLVFGPIPGAEPPETSEGPGIASGSGAARLAVRHFTEFTPEQRRAIESILIPTNRGDDDEGDDGNGGDEDSAEAEAPSVVLASVGASRFAQTPGEQFEEQVEGEVEVDEALTAEVSRVRDQLERRWDQPLSPIRLVGVQAPEAVWGENPKTVRAWANAVRRDPDTPSGYRLQLDDQPIQECMVALTPLGRGDRGKALESVLAHEAFHCMQDQLLRPSVTGDAPSWLIEGTAAWVGEAYARGSGSGLGSPAEFATPWWRDYIEDPDDLFARSYNAIGFWAQLDGALEGSLWTELPQILEQPVDGNAIAAYRAALALDQVFPAVWAPQHARRSDFWPQDVWELDLHELRAPEGLRAPVDEEDVARGLVEEGEWRETVPARTPWLYELTLPDPDEAEIETFTLEVKGRGRGWWINNRGLTQRRGIGFDGDRGELRALAAPGRDAVTSFTYCLLEREECSRRDLGTPLPSERLMIGVVGLEGEAEIVVSGEEACGGHPTPEAVIRACMEELGLGSAALYRGKCAQRLRPGDDPSLSICSENTGMIPGRVGPDKTDFTFALHFVDTTINLLLERSLDERGFRWAVLDHTGPCTSQHDPGGGPQQGAQECGIPRSWRQPRDE